MARGTRIELSCVPIKVRQLSCSCKCFYFGTIKWWMRKTTANCVRISPTKETGRFVRKFNQIPFLGTSEIDDSHFSILLFRYSSIAKPISKYFTSPFAPFIARLSKGWFTIGFLLVLIYESLNLDRLWWPTGRMLLLFKRQDLLLDMSNLS